MNRAFVMAAVGVAILYEVAESERRVAQELSRRRAAIIALVSMLIPVAAAANEIVVPRPKGWIGTVSDWMVGLGIVFVILGLVLLALAWRNLRAGAVTPTARERRDQSQTANRRDAVLQPKYDHAVTTATSKCPSLTSAYWKGQQKTSGVRRWEVRDA